MNDRRLLRNLALAILIKLLLLSALWWMFVRDQRVQVDAAAMAASFAGAADKQGER
ncbi:MAG TPA: hypothetical protein VJ652_14650 [Noviherbaspirillum sp.]|nr:hypothetical protein [Noviherbaspirillum sp.]